MKNYQVNYPCLSGLTLILAVAFALFAPKLMYGQDGGDGNPPIYIAFQWHMHQPIYIPGKSLVETDQGNHFSYSVQEIHTNRTGPYTNWPADAIQKGIDGNLDHLGAQVSFSGSLMQNLDNLQNNNLAFGNWEDPWNNMIPNTTELGNPRLDMVAFGYHHPLMPLIPRSHIRKQIQMHKEAYNNHFSGDYSKGIFPPENAFHPRIIPALKAEGLEWVMIDNIHFDRAAENYPYNTGSAIYEPNKADVQNPDPGDWVQLNNVWAPTQVSAQWGHQPHYVAYTDPETGEQHKIIGVPTSQYLGNEDGRGGFGALNYEDVMSQLESHNTDPDHPILIVLHHDGDNHGGGSSAYYGSNFQSFVDWVKNHPDRFRATTIQDYLEQFPPDENDVIHAEPGSWVGADGGDPEFKKWNADPNPETGYSPDRNSWAVITGTRNWVETAEQMAPGEARVETAWEFLMNAEASDYWYWDGSEGGTWDTNPTRASNLAYDPAEEVVSGSSAADETGPAIYFPQREPYNPGATEWTQKQPSDMTVWSYVYDLSGLASVTLKYREDSDGELAPSDTDNRTYAGGSGVGEWQSIAMDSTYIEAKTNLVPKAKAARYEAVIESKNQVLLDYYVEAVDSEGNVSRSPIEHVWIGESTSGGGGGDDNGGGGDSHFAMDGLLDEGVPVVAEAGDLQLHAAFHGDTLYVASESASSQGNDHFIMISGSKSTSTIAAPWAKSGEVAEWDLFLANESGNNWAGWFDNAESQPSESYLQLSAGNMLEGMVDLGEHFSDSVPDTVYLSLLAYGTNDGGALEQQVPAGNSDETVTSGEWLAFYEGYTYTSVPQSESEVPRHVELLGNYPNPFNPATTIRFRLAENATISLEVFNTLGQHVETLARGKRTAGEHQVSWNAANYGSGLYFYRLSVGNSVIKTGSMLLLK